MKTEKDRIAPHPVLPAYYGDEEGRRQRVDDMFDSSAKHYDWIVNVMSFGSGTHYRRTALLRAGLAPGMKVLDVGAGTGVVSLPAQKIVGDDGLVVAVDPSKGMLSEATKLGVKHAVMGLGEKLPIEDNVFDFVTMGYALRHVDDLTMLFTEYRRVLKPGGKILVLEISRPGSALGLAALKFYMKKIVPAVTRIARRSSEAEELMRYYWDTIEQCVPPETILAAMDEANVDKSERLVTMGIFSEYRGCKPE
ncbi:Ubiquinone/menaquinone biosynthesis methyltransferase family protein [hydrothermal vent metagenome]|uniref:Ubiquinone/menaquinone biosynthesis methyltransferase family protein n=1 Tax=hydrothermal vent metagenome TaxID=652676 RepID=A0A3B0ZEV3_9ZZZZ